MSVFHALAVYRTLLNNMVSRGLHLGFSGKHHHRLVLLRNTLLKEAEGMERESKGAFNRSKHLGS